VNKEYFILEDYLELKDPKVREHIRKSYEERLSGRTIKKAGDGSLPGWWWSLEFEV
jgi:hypothetical protein